MGALGLVEVSTQELMVGVEGALYVLYLSKAEEEEVTE